MSWTCKYCETKNPDSRSRCEVCGRKRESVSSVANEKSWTCEYCETKNSDSRSRCEVCGREREDVIEDSINENVIVEDVNKRRIRSALALVVVLGVLCLGVFLCAYSGTAIVRNISRASQQPEVIVAEITSTVYAKPSFHTVEPSSTPKPSNTVWPSRTPKPTKSPTPNPTRTVEPLNYPTDYNCPDLSGVKLRVGIRAQVSWDKVNLRSYARVPNDWDANVVAIADKGDIVTVIGGPECAHDGTWWEVKTSSGVIGWMREFLSDKRLLEPVP